MSKDDIPTKLEPRLRFPGFKGGPGWDTPAMSDLYGFRSTNSLSRDQLNYDSGSIYNIHYGDIHTKFRTQFRLENERVPFIDPIVAEALGDRFHLCREGDIILADASEDLNDVGKAIELISLGDHRVVAGTHTIHATRLGDNPVIGFGGYLFKSAAVRRGIHKEAQGAKVYGISSTRIGAVRLPLPHTTAEQRKIAECLGSLDYWIAAETDALAALRRYKTGLMQQLFPRPGQTRPRLRFPKFAKSKDWGAQKLGDVVAIFKGKGVAKADVVEGGATPCIRYAELYTVYGEVISEVKSSTNVPVEDLILSEANDVIVPASGETKEDIATCACVMDSGVALGSDLNVLRSEIDGRFFSYYLNGAKRSELAKLAQGDTVAHLYPSQISRLEINVPAEDDEQRRIADCLVSLDQRIAAQTDHVAALLRHKRGLMQQLFPTPDATEGGA